MAERVSSIIPTIVLGGLFGLSLAAPPGPMNAIIADESVNRGFQAGVLAGFGALTADLCFFVLAYLGGIAVIQSMPVLQRVMVIIGGLLMLYFAYDAIQTVRDAESIDHPVAGRGFWKAFILALTNPYQILFWLTVGIGLLTPGTVTVTEHVPVIGSLIPRSVVIKTGDPVLIVGLFMGILLWILSFPASLIVLDRRHQWAGQTIAYGSAMILAIFGVTFLLDGLSGIG